MKQFNTIKKIIAICTFKTTATAIFAGVYRQIDELDTVVAIQHDRADAASVKQGELVVAHAVFTKAFNDSCDAMDKDYNVTYENLSSKQADEIHALQLKHLDQVDALEDATDKKFTAQTIKWEKAFDKNTKASNAQQAIWDEALLEGDTARAMASKMRQTFAVSV
jgi:Skp family chaperone for outer membrane proteins